MIIFPAIDIKNKECVRLRQGRYDDVTVFSKDPLKMARHWCDMGAKYLHIVDLDGAFEGRPKNYSLIASICSSVNIPVQLGGGIRNIEVAKEYFKAGVSRLIIGTMFFENRDDVEKLCRLFPDKIGISLDVKDGIVKTRGWEKDTGVSINSIIKDVEDIGSGFIVYTDISKDGMQTGIDITPIKEILGLTKLPVIYAGGIRDMDDIKRLYPLSTLGLQGVITGRAIYEGSLDFKEANEWLNKKR